MAKYTHTNGALGGGGRVTIDDYFLFSFQAIYNRSSCLRAGENLWKNCGKCEQKRKHNMPNIKVVCKPTSKKRSQKRTNKHRKCFIYNIAVVVFCKWTTPKCSNNKNWCKVLWRLNWNEKFAFIIILVKKLVFFVFFFFFLFIMQRCFIYFILCFALRSFVVVCCGLNAT